MYSLNTATAAVYTVEVVMLQVFGWRFLRPPQSPGGALGSVGGDQRGSFTERRRFPWTPPPPPHPPLPPYPGSQPASSLLRLTGAVPARKHSPSCRLLSLARNMKRRRRRKCDTAANEQNWRWMTVVTPYLCCRRSEGEKQTAGAKLLQQRF